MDLISWRTKKNRTKLIWILYFLMRNCKEGNPLAVLEFQIQLINIDAYKFKPQRSKFVLQVLWNL